jgi:hypothetical protein
MNANPLRSHPSVSTHLFTARESVTALARCLGLLAHCGCAHTCLHAEGRRFMRVIETCVCHQTSSAFADFLADRMKRRALAAAPNNTTVTQELGQD